MAGTDDITISPTTGVVTLVNAYDKLIGSSSPETFEITITVTSGGSAGTDPNTGNPYMSTVTVTGFSIQTICGSASTTITTTSASRSNEYVRSEDILAS